MSAGATETTADKEVLELTEREKAILAGEDPDQVSEADTATEGDGQEDSAASPAGKDAGSSTPAADKEPEDETAASGGGKDSAAGAADSWVDDDARAMARSYGISESDLASFSSPEEFDRAAVLFDRNLAAGVKPVEPDKPVVDAAPVKPPEKPVETPPESQPGKLDVAAYENAGYDADTIALVKAHNAMVDRSERLSQSLAKLEQFHEAAQTSAEEARQNKALCDFHDALDQLDAGRYGRSLDEKGAELKLDPAVDENRKKVWDQANVLRYGIAVQAQQAGRPIPELPWPVLVRRAERLVFGEELVAAEKRRFQEKVSAQSRHRRPSPGRSKTVAVPVEKDGANEVANHPEVIKIWKQLQEASGGE